MVLLVLFSSQTLGNVKNDGRVLPATVRKQPCLIYSLTDNVFSIRATNPSLMAAGLSVVLEFMRKSKINVT